MKRFLILAVLSTGVMVGHSVFAEDAAPALVDAAVAMPDAAPVVAPVPTPPAPTPAPTVDPEDTNALINIFVGNLKDGKYGVAMFAGLLILVGFLRKIKKLEKYGWALNFTTAFAIAVLTGQLAGGAFDLALVWNAVTAAFTAAGVWEWIKDKVLSRFSKTEEKK